MASNNGIIVKVDDATFQRNMALYLQETSKAITTALDFKGYDGSREAIKSTPNANKGTIKATLDETSSKYPERTVAEMMVIHQKRASGEENYDLEEEVKLLKGKRSKGIGRVKSGWLPGLKIFLSKIHKSFTNVSGIADMERRTYGGAIPTRKNGDTYQCSFFNDIDGTGNQGFVNTIKEKAGEDAKNKVNADIVQYLSAKLEIPTDKFNKSN